MLVDLIIDGNYLLSKTVFPLHKSKMLYGSLFNVIKKSVSEFRSNYPYNNVYFVSDSKNKSWRKGIYNAYKDNRKKDNKIDWDFCYRTYDELKTYLKKETRIKVLEADEVEGDDWIGYLVNNSNNEGRSTVIVSNDYDIKQMIDTSLDPLYINIMVNEMYSQKKVFLPKHYNLFMNQLQSKNDNANIFDLTNDIQFLPLINSFINSCDVHIVNPYETLVLKLIIGDKGDNIHSAWTKVKAGRRTGIGETTGRKIMDKFLSENDMPDFNENKTFEDLGDIIREMKKLDAYEFDDIVKNLKFNKRLMSLNITDIPSHITERMFFELNEVNNNINNFDRLDLKEKVNPYQNFNEDFKLVDETKINKLEDDKDFFDLF